MHNLKLYASLALLLAFLSGCAHTVTQKDREKARISYDLGVNAFNRGDVREALRALLASCREDPKLADARQVLALVYHTMGKREEALQQYHAAIALQPQFSEAYNNMGILLLDMGRYDEAIEAFETALSDLLYVTPTLAEGNMGWAYFQKGDVDAAVEHIGNAVASNPQFCRGYEWLMQIGFHQERPQDVVANGQRFEKHCVQNDKVAATLSQAYRDQIDYYWALGYLKQGQRQKAQALLSRCAKSNPASDFSSRCATSLRAIE